MPEGCETGGTLSVSGLAESPRSPNSNTRKELGALARASASRVYRRPPPSPRPVITRMGGSV